MQLQPKPLFNPAGDDNPAVRRVLLGPTTNLVELDHVRYEWALRIHQAMLHNFWIPDDVNMSQDKMDYPLLTEVERRTYNTTLSSLTFLDSLQVANLPNLSRYVTAPEITLALTTQAFQEGVHSQSYGYILDSVADAVQRDAIFYAWRDDPHLLERNRWVAQQYETLITDPTPEHWVDVVVANLCLEGIYFFSGFAVFFALGRRGRMPGTVSEIRYIRRDELTHLALFLSLFRAIRSEHPEWVQVDRVREQLHQAAEQEMQWGAYVTQGQVFGLTPALLRGYIRWIANQRCIKMGIPKLYDQPNNPLAWVDQIGSMAEAKNDFFETTVESYVKSAGVLDWGDVDG